MVLKTKKHQLNDLSILVLRDGFSFCTHKKSCFYPIHDEDNINLQAIADFLDQEELTTEVVHLIHLDGYSSIVPMELFDKENAAFYISKGIDVKTNQEVVFDTLETQNQVVVYPRSTKKWNALIELFPTLESKHATSLLLAPLTQFSMGTPKKQLFVHLRDGAFELFLFQGVQLLFFNSFEQNNADEFLYYLFYITEQFYLKPESFKLAFLGEYDRFKEHYAAVQEYHEDIIYLEAPTENKNSKHPVPFLENKTA
jgi:hypothetical protein